jgi:PKD repeat protein
LSLHGGARESRRGRRSDGQSLTEFALVLPVLLLLTLIAIDFGRVYLGWVNLQNMARIAANFAATHPTAWATNDLATQAEYQAEIRADAKANNCRLPLVGGTETAPDPVFPSGTSIGGTARVDLSCSFGLITPIISGIVGSGGTLTVGASSTFPIKSGQFAGAGGGTATLDARFSGAPTTISDGSSVQFTDLSTGGPIGWSWDFGDGTTSTVQHPLHQYTLTNPAVAQTFTVVLTVTDGIGNDSLTKAGYITVNPLPPAADFTASPLSGDRPLVVAFTDLSSGPPTAWSWSFGDGGTSTAQNPTYTYTAAGTYTVTLTVTAPSGSSTITRTNYITVGPGVCTVPDFIGTSTATAQATWDAAGFTTTVLYQQGNRPWIIQGQTLVAGSSVPCDSTITVKKN